jgi:hypothetical protein
MQNPKLAAWLDNVGRREWSFRPENMQARPGQGPLEELARAARPVGFHVMLEHIDP